jgi:hypothetical protein
MSIHKLFMWLIDLVAKRLGLNPGARELVASVALLIAMAAQLKYTGPLLPDQIRTLDNMRTTIDASLRAIIKDLPRAASQGMMKQLDAVLHLLSEDRDGNVESIDERLRDVHVYAKLARLLLRDEEAGDALTVAMRTEPSATTALFVESLEVKGPEHSPSATGAAHLPTDKDHWPGCGCWERR